jgi:hypothetical protein
LKTGIERRVVLLTEHICTQKNRIDDHEERLREVEINQAVTNKIIETMGVNFEKMGITITNIEKFLRDDLSKMQVEMQYQMWEKMMDRLVLELSKRESENKEEKTDSKPMFKLNMELIKILGIIIVVIPVLVTAIIYLVKFFVK